MKIAMIHTDWADNPERMKKGSYGGVGYYRIVNPAKYMNHEVDVYGKNLHELISKDGSDEALADFFKKYDMVITKNIDHGPTAAAFCFLSQHFNVPLVIDYDDDIFGVRKDQQAYAYYGKDGEDNANRLVTAAFMAEATAIFVSTAPLKVSIQKHLKEVHGLEKPIFVLPNCNDAELWDIKRPTTADKERIVIGWQGSVTHDSDIKMFVKQVGQILKEYPNVHFELMGGIYKEKASEFFGDLDEDVLDRIALLAGTKTYPEFPEHLMSKEWDIGVAPLIDDNFNKSKSHIKWMEYAMMRIPTVASKVYPYEKPINGTPVIEHGKTGFLVENDGWYDQLKELIENELLRMQVGENAYNAVKENWKMKDHVDLYDKAIKEIWTNTKKDTQPTKKGKKKS